MDINFENTNGGLPSQENVTASINKPLRRSIRLSQKYENALMTKNAALKQEPMEITPIFATRSKSIQAGSRNSEDLLTDDEFPDTPLCLHQDIIENEVMMENFENGGIYRGINQSPSLSRMDQLNIDDNLTEIIQQRISRIKIQAGTSKSTSNSSMVGEARNVIAQTNVTRNNSGRRGKPRRKKTRSPKKCKILRKPCLKRNRHSVKTRLATSRKNYRQPSRKECCNRNRCNYQERLRNFKLTSSKRSPIRTRWVPLFQPSILPDRYPSHFTYQLPSLAAQNQNQSNLLKQHRKQCDGIPLRTPEHCSSTSSSPSLPNSLRGVFHTDDMHELLNIDRVAYRLYDSHVKTLAMVLNLDNNYLRGVLDKIVNIPSNVLNKVDTVMKTQFVKDDGGDLFRENTPPSPSSGVITSSPGLSSQRHFPSQRKN